MLANGSASTSFALVFVATLTAYWSILDAGFIWDDAGHVTHPALQSWAGLARIWLEPGAPQQYYPLLHPAFWLEHRLGGYAPFGYHPVNVLWHATAACPFVAVLRRLAVPGALLAGLLFALHPVSVESVAWIAEQKNTLSTVLYLAAALAWLRFDSDAGDAAPSPRSSGHGEGAAAPTRPRTARLYWLATTLLGVVVWRARRGSGRGLLAAVRRLVGMPREVMRAFRRKRPHFERALVPEPEPAALRQTYGRVLLNAGEYESVGRTLRAALRLNPALTELHRDLALALHRLGRTEEARIHALEADRDR